MSHPNDFDIGDDFVDANIGSVLDGRYLLVRNVGSGGMGIVYEAQHQSIRSRHAVKILHKHLMARPEVVKRFVNEARAAGGLGHPNIVRSTDMGKTAEGIPYVVFEFLEGVTLKEELVDAGPLPLARVLDIAIQTASALEAAHKQKIIHRDVKPENVFLIRTQDGHDAVKLIDFGIAKF
ncbi:MAG: serine/threonine protein kinase, partial [Myxococcales bacterium]|nr:serine/threonine protein kinase [Myxococcales bacterium]